MTRLWLVWMLPFVACFTDSGGTPDDDAETSAGSESSEGAQSSESTGAPPSDAPMPDLYWSFDNIVSGTVFADQGEVDGILNAAMATPGQVGDGLGFNGSNQHVDFGHVAETFAPNTAQFTIAMWIRVETGVRGALLTKAMAPSWGCSPMLNAAQLVTGHRHERLPLLSHVPAQSLDVLPGRRADQRR